MNRGYRHLAFLLGALALLLVASLTRPVLEPLAAPVRPLQAPPAPAADAGPAPAPPAPATNPALFKQADNAIART